MFRIISSYNQIEPYSNEVKQPLAKLRRVAIFRNGNQRRPQKFFQGGGGGKRRIHYPTDKIKPYNCHQDFAKGFEPKVNMTLLKKCWNLVGVLSKMMQFKCIMEGGPGAKPQSPGNFRNFWKKITALTSFESHFERF